MTKNKSLIQKASETKALTAAGLLGTFAVALAVMERTSTTTSEIKNAPGIFFASFLRGLSETADDETSLDPDSVAIAESISTQHSPILDQIKKEFDELYNTQKEFFETTAKNLQESPDREKDFLTLPKQESLALDRSCRSFLLREHPSSKKSLAFFDDFGHNYSAATNVALLNLSKLGERLGNLTGAQLTLISNLKPVLQLYFLANLVNKEVLESPIGKALGLEKLFNAKVKKSIAAPFEKAIQPTKWIADPFEKVKKVTRWITIPFEKATQATKWITSPLREDGATSSVGAALGAIIGGSATGGSLSGTFIGGVIGKFATESILSAKTYIVAPALAGLFDGLTEPISQDAFQRVKKATAKVTEEDEKTFFASIYEDFNIAYNSALERFQKYDKLFEQEIIQKKEVPIEKSSLKKNLYKAKDHKAASGREILLTGEKKEKKALEISDKLRATAQAGASVVAARSYRAGKSSPGAISAVANTAMGITGSFAQKAVDLGKILLQTKNQREQAHIHAKNVARIKRQQKKRKGR